MWKAVPACLDIPSRSAQSREEAPAALPGPTGQWSADAESGLDNALLRAQRNRHRSHAGNGFLNTLGIPLLPDLSKMSPECRDGCDRVFGPPVIAQLLYGALTFRFCEVRKQDFTRCHGMEVLERLTCGTHVQRLLNRRVDQGGKLHSTQLDDQNAFTQLIGKSRSGTSRQHGQIPM